MRDYLGVPVLHVNGAYPGKVTEARLGVVAQDGPSGLSCMCGDDQVVCAARGAGPADMGEQAPMVSRCRLRVVKDIDGGHYRNERPGAFGWPAGRICQFDPHAVPGDRYSNQNQSAPPSQARMWWPPGPGTSGRGW